MSDVVVEPPDGNNPDVPGQRQMSPNCNHVWERKSDPLNRQTGKMICLRCRAIVPAPTREPVEYTPRPADPYTGY
jgi:hypothetical protein